MKKISKLMAHSCLAASLLIPATAVAADPRGFKVTMEMFRNGKLMGESIFTFTSRNDQWTMSSETTGTKGLARIVGLKEHSTSRGDWNDKAPRPLKFERNVKAVKTFRWTAEFDWQRGEVHSSYPDGEATLEIETGVVDESTLGMLIRGGLKRGQDEWFLQVLDEDEIEQQHYRSRPVEQIQTTLGCITAYPVEKIRREGSTRYTRTYHARDHDFVPVLIEHGKTDGDHLESRLKTLEIEGETVLPVPDCD